MSAQKNAASREILQYRNCILQAGAISFGIAWPGRAVGPILTVGKIAAQHDETRVSKRVRQSNQQRGLAV